MQQSELEDSHDQEQLEEALGAGEELIVLRQPDLDGSDQQSDDPADHARQSEPVGTVRCESCLEDRDACEGGEQEDREEGPADQSVLITDQHPHDADECGGDERADGDPDRPCLLYTSPSPRD